MRNALIICLAVFSIVGCLCGCSKEPAATQPPAETPEVTQSQTPETIPADTPSQPEHPHVTQPQMETPSQPILPQETSPQPTKPQAPESWAENATVPAAGTLIDNLVCAYTIDNGQEKVLSNPTASFFYHYIRTVRSNAQQQKPPANGDDSNQQNRIHLSFRIDQKEITYVTVYADDHASIPVTLGFPVYNYFQFEEGTYNTLLNTLNKQ